MPTTDKLTATGDDIFRTTHQPEGAQATAVGSRARAVRRAVGAAALPGLFVVMIVGTAIDPLEDSSPPAATIAAASGHAGAITALAWLELLGAALCVGGLLTLVGAVRRRGAGFANASGVLGVLVGIGMASIGVNHFLVAGLVGSGLSAPDAVKVLEGFRGAAGPIPVLFMLPPLAYLLATLTAWRAGLVPRAALVLGVLFAVVVVVPGPPLVSFISLGVGLVLTAWIAKGLLAARD